MSNFTRLMSYLPFKRLLDIFLCLIAIPVLLVPFLIWLLIKFIVDGRPLFFFQIRSGRNYTQFTIIKLRTLTTSGDVTKLGKIERKWGIDEWPQIIQILIGKMSWIGPRPLLPQYDVYYSEIHKKRFLVRPGITGLAQVHGRNKLSWKKRLDLDNDYVENVSFLLDIEILFRTFLVILFSGGEQPSEPFNGTF